MGFINVRSLVTFSITGFLIVFIPSFNVVLPSFVEVELEVIGL